jgi:hypothetical protein
MNRKPLCRAAGGKGLHGKAHLGAVGGGGVSPVLKGGHTLCTGVDVGPRKGFPA